MFKLWGSIPESIMKVLVEATESVPEEVFFERDGRVRKDEIKEIDGKIKNFLEKKWKLEKVVVPDTRFDFDLAFPKEKILIHIEKGKLARLELDILKALSLCHRQHEWKYYVMIVPSNIELTLAPHYSPCEYLKHLIKLAEPLLEKSGLEGFYAICYEDPRIPSTSGRAPT